MTGQPIQIVEPISSTTDNYGLKFNPDFVQCVVSLEKLSRTPVVVISVAGAFRKGKSFLLNFFLRYLTALSSGDTHDWIHSAEGLDGGFRWRAGCDRDTTGIIVWSEPFFIRKPSGQEVAVLLMDTQGTFDHESSQRDCTTIFAFSTLVSSVQIFNISQNILETDLQHLRLFVEFAAMAKESKEKVLQHFWFLVRDWQNPGDHDYGVIGGESYLNKVLACDTGRPKENLDLRQGIQQHFEKSSCCLLPHPGKCVTSKDFQGQVDQLDADFVEHLEAFVSHILSPENLVVKKVNGKELTGGELFKFVDVYFQAFRLGKLPTPRCIFTATVEMANMTAAADARKQFESSLQTLAKLDRVVSDDELNNLLDEFSKTSVNYFDSRCMERGSSSTVRVRDKLEKELRGRFQHQHTMNQLKSDKLATEEKTRILTDDIRRAQEDIREAFNESKRLEDAVEKRWKDIQAQTISKEQMDAWLQEAMVNSVAMKDFADKRAELNRLIETMAEKNKELADEIKENKELFIKEQQEMMAQFKREMETKEKDVALIQGSFAVAGSAISAAATIGSALLSSTKCGIS